MIIAKIKSLPKWKDYKTCSLGISLQSRNHVGERFEAIVDWVNSTGDQFDKCLVDLSDTLHRHNFVLEKGMSYPEAHAHARALGDKWLRENGRTLDKLKMPVEIIRWDTWLEHEQLAENRRKFQVAFDTNLAFRNALMADVQHYFERVHGLSLSVVPYYKIKLSAEYLLEELAAHALYFDKYPCATIYPGRQQASFKLVREGFVPGVPQGMTRSCFVAIYLYDLAQQVVSNGNTQVA